MKDFHYKALDKTGRRIKGKISALTEASAITTLSVRSLEVYKIRELPPQLSFMRLGSRASSKDLTRLVRQLSVLLQSGVDLSDSLSSLTRGHSNPIVSEAVAQTLTDLRGGKNFSSALEANFPELPKFVSRLAELGETTGRLGDSLNDAADRMELDEKMRQEIRGALTYPSFLAIIGSTLVILMFIFVVPRFANLIGENTSNIPTISRVVIQTGTWMSDNTLLFMSLSLGTLAGLIFAMRSDGLKAGLKSISERIPFLGAMLIRGQLGLWAGTVGIALNNGAMLTQAMKLGEGAVTSQSLKSAFEIVRSRVRKGEALDVIISEEITDFSGLGLEMIRTGQVSGKLGEMLIFIGSMEEEETRRRAMRISAIAEPLAILFISAVVGTVVIAIVLAMTSVYDFAI